MCIRRLFVCGCPCEYHIQAERANRPGGRWGYRTVSAAINTRHLVTTVPCTVPKHSVFVLARVLLQTPQCKLIARSSDCVVCTALTAARSICNEKFWQSYQFCSAFRNHPSAACAGAVHCCRLLLIDTALLIVKQHLQQKYKGVLLRRQCNPSQPTPTHTDLRLSAKDGSWTGRHCRGRT